MQSDPQNRPTSWVFNATGAFAVKLLHFVSAPERAHTVGFITGQFDELK